MGAFEIAMGIFIIVFAAILIVCVLLQSGKDKSLSGTITGVGETFFTKGKSKSRDVMFSRLTTVLSFVFVVLAVVLYIAMAN